MDEEWDSDNFKPEVVAVAANKWEGEDEEEDVKDSWDAEEDEEEKKDDEKPEPKPKQKPKKTLAEKLAEKEKLKQEELERKAKEKEEEVSPEEQLRRQKESDLQIALETTFGVESKATGIDAMNPNTKEEFAELADALNKKLTMFVKNPEFPAFAEDHIRNLCASLSSGDLKKLKTTIDNMYIEKQKVEKGDKAKKNKGKGKAKLRVEGDNALNEYSAYGDYDEYEDFM